VLLEDSTRNRLDESLDLFSGLISLPWFAETSVILFLNKHDIFKQKIIHRPLGQYHPDFDGLAGDEKAALTWIQTKYESIELSVRGKKEEEDKLYVHITNATETKNIFVVWSAVKIILYANFAQKHGIVI
jgi:hypothetical protein